MAIVLEPPPTVNHLDRRERIRLVRSNRKLEAVLGAAPYYLEPDSPLDMPKASRREGRIFAHSPTSSSSSPTLDSITEISDKPSHFNPLRIASKSKQGPRTLELSRPLLLRLRSKPVSPSGNRTSQSSSRRPSLTPVTPPSPTFTIDSEKLQASSLKTRRKKMEKLTRTLGENIPTELVFPSDANTIRTHIKSKSLEEMPVSSSSPKSVKPRPVISRPRAISSRSRHKIPPLPSNTIPTPNTAPIPAVHIHLPTRQTSQAKPTLAESRRKPRPRSLSVSTGINMLTAAAAAQARPQAPAAKRRNNVLVANVEVLRVQTSMSLYPEPQYLTVYQRATKDIFESHSPLPFQPVETPQQPCAKLASISSPALHPSVDIPSTFCQFGKRKELGWSGEWNHDMGNVVKNLRNLKAR